MTRRATSSSEVIWTANDLSANPHLTADKADRVRRMFSAIADTYDLNNRLHSMGRDQAWRKKAVKLAAVQPDDEVLDVACGTGDLSLAFARAGAKSVTGVDFSERMLEIARQKGAAASRGAGHGPSGKPTPTFQFADAMNLPFENNRFNIVSIAFGIRNVENRKTTLREFVRVLRPGGRVVVLEFSEPDNSVMRAACNLYTRHVMPFTAGLIARDRCGAYKYLPRSVATFPQPDEFMSEMRAAGFADVSRHPMTFGICSAYVGRRV